MVQTCQEPSSFDTNARRSGALSIQAGKLIWVAVNRRSQAGVSTMEPMMPRERFALSAATTLDLESLALGVAEC